MPPPEKRRASCTCPRETDDRLAQSEFADPTAPPAASCHARHRDCQAILAAGVARRVGFAEVIGAGSSETDIPRRRAFMAAEIAAPHAEPLPLLNDDAACTDARCCAPAAAGAVTAHTAAMSETSVGRRGKSKSMDMARREVGCLRPLVYLRTHAPRHKRVWATAGGRTEQDRGRTVTRERNGQPWSSFHYI